MADPPSRWSPSRGYGNREALDRLIPLVYNQLRALARSRIRGERRDHTLTSGALVHEAYLNDVLVNQIVDHVNM